jgi:hypothetical protein
MPGGNQQLRHGAPYESGSNNSNTHHVLLDRV